MRAQRIRIGTNTDIDTDMPKAVDLAIAALTSLPDSDQERLSRHLLGYIERFLRLRVEIHKGIRALAATAGEPLDVEVFLRRQHERHGRA
jgi:hypothetical protein